MSEWRKGIIGLIGNLLVVWLGFYFGHISPEWMLAPISISSILVLVVIIAWIFEDPKEGS